MMYVEELPEEKTYYIKVYGDDIEDFLKTSLLPDRMKQNMREDVVRIVKDYEKFVKGKPYNQDTRNELYDFFRTKFKTFVMTHGIFYSFEECN